MAKKPPMKSPMKAAAPGKPASKAPKAMAVALKAGKGPPAFGPKKKSCK